MKYIAYVRKRFSESDFPVFTIADVKTALKGTAVSYEYVRLLLHNLKRKGEIKAITRGYTPFRKTSQLSDLPSSPSITAWNAPFR